MEWQKLFANDAIDKCLISKFEQFIQLKKKKKNTQIMGRRPKRTFFQR